MLQTGKIIKQTAIMSFLTFLEWGLVKLVPDSLISSRASVLTATLAHKPISVWKVFDGVWQHGLTLLASWIVLSGVPGTDSLSHSMNLPPQLFTAGLQINA